MNVFKKILLGFLFLIFAAPLYLHAQIRESSPDDAKNERQYLIKTLTKIADPVLNALSKNELRLRMPVEGKEGKKREYCSHLEAFGRLLDGMAPWLELGPDNTPEGELREKY